MTASFRLGKNFKLHIPLFLVELDSYVEIYLGALLYVMLMRPMVICLNAVIHVVQSELI